MTELSLKTKHRLNMNLYKDKVWVTVKKIFFPVTILAEDLCYAKNLIFSSIRIEQWDPKLFNDKFSVYIRNGVHCCVLSRLTKDDLRWFYQVNTSLMMYMKTSLLCMCYQTGREKE